MTNPQTAPYGSWKSPITSDLVVAQSIRLSEPDFDGQNIIWLELRPQEGGRQVLVRRTPTGEIEDLTPAPFNVRTRVHEYGGGAYAIGQNGVVWFSNFADQRLYRMDPGQPPQAITPESALRYADGVSDAGRGLLFCVREDHRAGGEPINAIVVVQDDGDPDGGRVIVAGNDFYAAPRLSPDGSRLAWITWNHPNMPWDGTELWVAEVNRDGSLGQATLVAGGPAESIVQPEWSPDGTLYFISDRTDWWNLYRIQDGEIQAIQPMEAEFGGPMWRLRTAFYAFESAERIICAYPREGSSRLAVIDMMTLEMREIETPYTSIGSTHAAPGKVLFLAGSPAEASALVQLDLDSGHIQVLRRSSEIQVDSGYVSVAQAIEFPTEGGLTAHAYYYHPKNRDYAGPADERPPLLVLSHGGPTSATSPVFQLQRQYWTSRGIGVVDVNYGGSTGYGRAYRKRLNGQWGIVDVDDCVNAARYLVEQGRADPQRLAIAGGSAGGYTTLCALTFRDFFSAGASYFGVADPEALARDTHKFESRYLDNLIGPYPEAREVYSERSPIHHVDLLNCPLILFQGLEDRVVPPSQAELMFEAVRAKGLPVAYLPFEGEQHGFRQAKNIKRALDAEIYFYSKVFGFDLADDVEPVEIENLS
jgi:dipeptidyl aminopeptidase/acylaminoacyl peptidase